MKDMLYIDGQLVDLGEGVDITLNYKSNLLTDLGKIVGNNSYTIKLPKTMRNLGIIGISDVPSVVSSFPRVSHKARYFRNGIEIISEGKAVLMGVGDSIEVVLTWGGTSAFSRLVNEGRNLTDFIESNLKIMWGSVSSKSLYNGTDYVMFTDNGYGLKDNETLATIHPSVRLSYVIDMIASKYGMKIEFPSDKREFLSSLIIPLLTRNGGYANREESLGNVIRRSDGTLQLGRGGANFASYFEAADYPVGVTKVLKSGKLVVFPSFRSMNMGVSLNYGTDNIEENIAYLPYEIDNGITAFPYVYNKPIEIDVNEGDVFAMTIGLSTFYEATGENNSVYKFGIQPEEIQMNEYFPIVENLPDIKVVDFLKAVASLLGVFAVPAEDGDIIRFVSFDALSDRTRAVDWSDKLLPLDYMNRPRNIGYVLEDFAQNNRMTWKEDDTVTTWADGNIIVGDNNLEYERDAVKLPFAPTDMKMGKASIKLYEYNDDGEPELQDVEPRLLVEKNVGGYSTGSFEGLHWSTLIANYYRTYQNAVKTPVLITENIMLDELSLRDLDVSVPVYLRQYGKYYAIVEVKAPSNGVCECKLLQLD